MSADPEVTPSRGLVACRAVDATESTSDGSGDVGVELVEQLRDEVAQRVPDDVAVRPAPDGFAVGYGTRGLLRDQVHSPKALHTAIREPTPRSGGRRGSLPRPSWARSSASRP